MTKKHKNISICDVIVKSNKIPPGKNFWSKFRIKGEFYKTTLVFITQKTVRNIRVRQICFCDNAMSVIRGGEFWTFLRFFLNDVRGEVEKLRINAIVIHRPEFLY